jgi:excisionase family DNA binding protein
MAPTLKQADAAPSEWLSLGPASRMLGVDPDTLRRWADGGRIPAFSTIGGHRRFPRQAIAELVEARSAGRPTLAGLGATPERVSAAYRRSYQHRRRDGADARQTVKAAERDAFRADGRRLVAALLRSLDARDAGDRAAAEKAATRVAADLGRRLAGSSTSLTDAVSLFVAARRPFLSELGGLGRRRRLGADQLSGLYEGASSLLDRLLLAFVAGHQSAIGAPAPATAPQQGARA